MPTYEHLIDEQIRAYTDRIKRAQEVFAAQQKMKQANPFYEREFDRWQHRAQKPPLHGATDFVKGRDGVWRMADAH